MDDYESKSLKGVKVGDTVIVPTWNRREKLHDAEKYTITRVGRTLVYIQAYGQEVGFYMEDGSERCDYQPRRAYLPEAWSQEVRHVKVVSRLRDEYKVGSTGYGGARISREAWAEILQVLDRHAKKDD